MVARNPHSFYKTSAVNFGGVTGVSDAGVFDSTEFSAKTAPVAADLAVIQDSEDSNAPKKCTLANLVKGISPHAASAKTTPVAADTVLINNSEASNVAAKATLTNLTKGLAVALAGTETASAMTGSATTGALAVSPGGASAKTAPVAADKVLICDTEDSNANKSVTISNLTKGLGISAVTAKVTPISADATIINDSADSNKAKSVTLANMASFYGAIAQLPADLKSSLFVTYAEFDAGTDAAVDTKLTDALEAKGQLIAAFGIVNELWNGTGDSTVVLSSAATGATPIASSIVMDKDSGQNGNTVGAVMGAWPVAGANSIVAANGDVYAYTAGDGTRTTGKLGFVLLWMKTA